MGIVYYIAEMCASLSRLNGNCALKGSAMAMRVV